MYDKYKRCQAKVAWQKSPLPGSIPKQAKILYLYENMSKRLHNRAARNAGFPTVVVRETDKMAIFRQKIGRKCQKTFTDRAVECSQGCRYNALIAAEQETKHPDERGGRKVFYFTGREAKNQSEEGGEYL